MSITKNVFNLNKMYDLVLSGGITYCGSAPPAPTSGPVLVAGTLFTWGNNCTGTLGLNDIVSRSSPVQVPGTWKGVVGKTRWTGALKNDGTLWLWGDSITGNNVVPTNRSSPVQIPGATWCFLGGTELFFQHAIKTDGTLWSWGGNGEGTSGVNNTIEYSSPVQVPGTTWSEIDSDAYSTIASKSDGTLWSWGRGPSGAGDNIRYSSPVQIPGTNWLRVHKSASTTFATKTDGTLWGWGGNGSGVLGINSTAIGSYSSPIQIPGTTWKNVWTGGGSVFATKTDNTLWAWGTNTCGSLGVNSGTQPSYSSPTQIPGTWCMAQRTSINGYGGSSTAGVKTDGTGWVWGKQPSSGNYAGGTFGLNIAPSTDCTISSPVQLPGSWECICGGHWYSGQAFGIKKI